MMNRQRDAEGENASHGQSDEGGVKAEAGSLGRLQEQRGESQGQRHVAKTSLIPQALLHPLLSEKRRALRISTDMKGWL